MVYISGTSQTSTPIPSEDGNPWTGEGGSKDWISGVSQGTAHSSCSKMAGLAKACAVTKRATRSCKCPHMDRLLGKAQVCAFDIPPKDGNCMKWARYRVHCLLSSQHFDAIVGVVVFLNSLAIGWESQAELSSGVTETHFVVLEQIFLCFYCVEILLRFFAHRWTCLMNNWVRFDIALVSTGVLGTWVVKPVLTGITGGGQTAIQAAEPLTVLRMLRLLRLVRALRLLVQFKTLWKMIRGLLYSASTMFYTFVIVTLMLYIFSCAAIELITKNYRAQPEHPGYSQKWAEVVEEYYSGIGWAMVTLIQFVVLDSIRESYIPLVKEEPMMLFFFVGFMLIVSVSMMNLVTAVIVEGSFEQGKLDHESDRMAQASSILPKLRAAFHEMDLDDNGTITMEEVAQSDQNSREELMKVLNADSVQEVFDMLDVDGNGEVDIDEFIEGIVRVVTTTQPVEFICVMKQLGLNRLAVENLQAEICGLRQFLRERPTEDADLWRASMTPCETQRPTTRSGDRHDCSRSSDCDELKVHIAAMSKLVLDFRKAVATEPETIRVVSEYKEDNSECFGDVSGMLASAQEKDQVASQDAAELQNNVRELRAMMAVLLSRVSDSYANCTAMGERTLQKCEEQPSWRMPTPPSLQLSLHAADWSSIHWRDAQGVESSENDIPVKVVGLSERFKTQAGKSSAKVVGAPCSGDCFNDQQTG